MLIPGSDKQNQKYNEARARIIAVYQAHPHLESLAEKMQECIQTHTLKGSSTRLEQLRQAYRQYCQKHDIPANFAQPDFDCQECRDSGWLQEDNVEASQVYGYDVKKYVKCSCLLMAEKQLRIKKLFHRARMTAEMQEQTFAKFRVDLYSKKKSKDGTTYHEIMTYNKQMAQRFVASVAEAYHRVNCGLSLGVQLPSIFFHGPTGVGKTFLCSAMANALLDVGVPVLYMPFADLLGTIRASFGEKNSNNSEQLLQEVREVEVLILDDLGAENVTGFVGETLFTILNYRLTGDFKPLVISSNMDLQQLGQVYNQRISSRLERYALVLECVGDDLRQKFALYKEFKGFPSWK